MIYIPSLATGRTPNPTERVNQGTASVFNLIPILKSIIHTEKHVGW